MGVAIAESGYLEIYQVRRVARSHAACIIMHRFKERKISRRRSLIDQITVGVPLEGPRALT